MIIFAVVATLGAATVLIILRPQHPEQARPATPATATGPSAAAPQPEALASIPDPPAVSSLPQISIAPAPAPVPPPTIPVRARAPSSTRFAIQVGAFLDPGNAASVMRWAADRGLEAQDLVERTSSGQALHKIRIGAYDTRDEAEHAMGLLERHDFSPLVVELGARQ